MIVAGWVMTVALVLFMIGASVMPKLLRSDWAARPFERVGWDMRFVRPVGLIELACIVLFVVPQTAVFGGVLFTGLLGGALAANLRVGNPLFSHTLFSIYLGTFSWIALWLREPALREVLPLTVA